MEELKPGMLKTILQIMSGIVALALLLIFALGMALSQGKHLQDVHVPSSFTEQFDYDNGDFAAYRAWNERRVRASRNDNPPEDVIANLMPFELVPESDCPLNPDGRYPDAIVLVHGLIASPWSMKHIGEYFQSRCFYVLGVLLPGHGTRIGDMLDATWEQWQRDVNFATTLAAEKADRVYVSGHSAGGTMAVLEASRNPDVDALILFAPAMAVDVASRYAIFLSMLGKWFPGAAWFEVEPEDAVYRYESFPFSAVAQTWELIQATQQNLVANPLTIPVMTVTSAQDTTVDVQATFDFMQALDNPLSFTLLYAQHELPPYNRTRVVNSNAPADGIISMGHLGLMTPPDHPHYGRNGAYRYCGQYFGDDNDNFARCKAGERDFYGEATEENRALGLIERIAFNPFYDDLLDEIALFLDQVGMDTRGLPLPPRFPDSTVPNLDQ